MKKLLIILLSVLITISLFSVAFTSFSKAQTGSQSVNFRLFDIYGNQISSVIFGNVTSGTSSTVTCTMSSTDHVTVYPIWNATNLPTGVTISGYWNGPEVWNANTGRMWNTWDIVTLQWTLTVPENNSYASNVIVNVIVNSPSLSTSPTPASTLMPTLVPTATPTPTLLPTITSTVKPNVTATPTKQPVSLSSTEYSIMGALAVALIAGMTVLAVIKYLPRKRIVISTAKFPFFSGVLIFFGAVAFLLDGSSVYYIGSYVYLFLFTVFLTMILALRKILFRLTALLSAILVTVELITGLIYFQYLSLYGFYPSGTNFESLWFEYAPITAFCVTIIGFVLIIASRNEFNPLELRRRLRDYLLRE